MVRLGQFSTLQNTSLIHAARLALHLRNQRSEKLLSLQKRFCHGVNVESRVVFSESLLVLFALGKIDFYPEADLVIYRED
ncbi:hypothetical protein F9C43_27005 [Pseudomonas aeruginosa]|uniref:ABC-three component system middle component 8 n=1 Tax=Pseudomonas aeruginosa TaxID=287 RepID=UPI0013EFE1C5|nr:ABC-three component system middle component 8 [Pseudomonas aeruginosa]QII96899.1 hypothetical protein F9C43_27005 [Pseudomonas aeruginosa]